MNSEGHSDTRIRRLFGIKIVLDSPGLKVQSLREDRETFLDTPGGI